MSVVDLMSYLLSSVVSYDGVDGWLCLVGLCFYFFFFFKQKTAYEMRISDWSSDVCSSDLPMPMPTPTPTPRYSNTNSLSFLSHFSPSTPQIGRASCRERVCQYV